MRLKAWEKNIADNYRAMFPKTTLTDTQIVEAYNETSGMDSGDRDDYMREALVGEG